MSAVESARHIYDATEKLNKTLLKLQSDEVAIGKTVGTRSKVTPDSLATVTARAQILALTELIGVIGGELTEHLIQVAEDARRIGD